MAQRGGRGQACDLGAEARADPVGHGNGRAAHKELNTMMTRHRILTAGIVAVVLAIGVLKVYVTMTPLVRFAPGRPTGEAFEPGTKLGQVFSSVQKCAEWQRDLFGCVEAYREKNGHLPDSMDALINDNPSSMAFTHCPLELSGYVIHTEAYGNPGGVFISEKQNRHGTPFMLWFRGIRPCVQTMGDGTVRMFEGRGLQVTLPARQKGTGK
jgi:hypothetical protein